MTTERSAVAAAAEGAGRRLADVRLRRASGRASRPYALAAAVPPRLDVPRAGSCSSSRPRSPTGGSTSRTTPASSSRSTRRPASARGSARPAAARPPRPRSPGTLVFVTLHEPAACNRKQPSGLTASSSRSTPAPATVRWRRRSGRASRRRSSPTAASTSATGTAASGASSARTGQAALAFQVGAARSRARVAISGNRLYVGDYDGHLYALDARTGKLLWRGSSQAAARRPRQVLLDAGGRLRPRLHRLDRRQGLLLRRDERQAALVARRPAATSTPRRPSGGSASSSAPTAAASTRFDAATGDVKWTVQGERQDLRLADGPRRRRLLRDAEASAPTGSTRAPASRCGRGTDGKYSPVVADDERLYLVGYARVYGLVER